MAAHPPSATAPGQPRRLRWAFWFAVLLVGVAAALALLLVGRGSGSSGSLATPPAADAPSATWKAGEVPAPGFRLADENGKRFSLASLRGRPVVVVFIDPLCQDYCPIEAKGLSDVVHSVPAASRPAIVAVSVNPLGNARANLMRDARKWKLVPQWRWAVGSEAELAPVWHRYHVAVLPVVKKVKGVTTRDVAHTEAAYLVDANGYERALFLWPYRPAAVIRAIAELR